MWEEVGWTCKRVTEAWLGAKNVEVRDWDSRFTPSFYSRQKSCGAVKFYYVRTRLMFAERNAWIYDTDQMKLEQLTHLWWRGLVRVFVAALRLHGHFILTALRLSRPGWAGCLICADALLWLDSGLYKHRSICSLQPQRLCTHKLNCHALCIEKQQQPGPLRVDFKVWPIWCLFSLCGPAKRNLCIISCFDFGNALFQKIDAFSFLPLPLEIEGHYVLL